MQTQRTKEKIEENLALLCTDLGIDQNSSDPVNQRNIALIYNALSWIAEDVFKQCNEVATSMTAAVIVFNRPYSVQVTRGRSYSYKSNESVVLDADKAAEYVALGIAEYAK